jgi:hypothetical protein
MFAKADIRHSINQQLTKTITFHLIVCSGKKKRMIERMSVYIHLYEKRKSISERSLSAVLFFRFALINIFYF